MVVSEDGEESVPWRWAGKWLSVKFGSRVVVGEDRERFR